MELTILGKKFDVWEIEKIEGEDGFIKVTVKGKIEKIPCKNEIMQDVIDDVFSEWTLLLEKS